VSQAADSAAFFGSDTVCLVKRPKAAKPQHLELEATTPMNSRVYLDWNATAPLRPEARAALAAHGDVAGNPSSIHAEGRAARTLVEAARDALARALGADARNVIFTSGGTEANGLGLTPGMSRKGSSPAKRLIVSAIEHASVLAGGQFMRGDIAVAPVDGDGIVDRDALRALLHGKPAALVSVMLANNETGALQPIAEIADIVHEAGGLLHVDAIQAFGKIPVAVGELKADLLSVSAHKIGGPKGVGALVLTEGIEGVAATIRGGGQERGRRAGTENVAGIAAFGAAVDAAIAAMPAESAAMANLRNRLESGLKRHPSAVFFSETVPRLPNTTLFSAPGLKAETAVIAFDLEGIALSSGSACSSGKVQPSHVLAAMGVAPDLIQGALRVSLGWQSQDADIDRCLEAWRKLSGVLRKGNETGLERF